MSSMYDGEDAGPAGPFVEEELAQAEEFDGVLHPDPDEENSTEDEIVVGGELDHSEEAVPLDLPPSDAKTHAIFNEDYTVTPEAGYRRS